MTDKRKFTRYECKIKANFDYFEGDPEKIDINTSIPKKGSGYILDLCAGGLLIATKNRLGIGMPVKIIFSIKNNDYNIEGKIIRTGLIENNPSEVAKKFAKYTNKGDIYIAIEFNDIIDFIPENVE